MNTEYIKAALVLTGEGMLGIFAVMAAIAIIVYLITKFSKK